MHGARVRVAAAVYSARDGASTCDACCCTRDAADGAVAVGVASCSLHAMPSSTFSVRVGGIAFALIFTAYNTSQNYMTTLLGPRLGSMTLVLVYSGLIIATPIAPAAAPNFGIPVTLATGGLTYAALMLALLLQSTSLLPDALATTLVLLASLINGFGGALLWSAQGSLVILESSGGDGGRQSGDFWALFQVSAIVGNLWAFFSFSAGAQPTALFAVFLGIALLGCACFVCVRPSPLALVEAAIADTSAVELSVVNPDAVVEDAATPSARTAAKPGSRSPRSSRLSSG